MQLSSTRHF